MPDDTTARQAGDLHRRAALTEAEIAAAEDAPTGSTQAPAEARDVDVRLQHVAGVGAGPTLIDALARRRTSREPPEAPLAADELAALLGHAASVADDGRRPYPSAGARYPLRLDVITLRCEDIPAGVYRYAPAAHGLRTIAVGDRTAALEAAFGRAWIRRARAVLVISVDLPDATAEHGLRGYRYALLEAGHLAQNLLLLATTAGLPACPLGGFADATLREVVTDADADEREPVYAVVL